MLKLNALNSIQLVYINRLNSVDTSIFLKQDVSSDFSDIGYRFGGTVCGSRVDDTIMEAYLFGGTLLDNTTGDTTLMNDLVKIGIIIGFSDASVSEVLKITPDTTVAPPVRSFCYSKIAGSFIYIWGGVDQNKNPLPDIQRYSLLNNQQTEMIPTGNPPSPRVFM